MPDHIIASAFRGFLTQKDIDAIDAILSSVSNGRFIEILLSNVSDIGSVYLDPIRLNTEQDVKAAIRPFYDGRLGFEIGEELLSGLCSSIAEILMNACMHADAKDNIVFVGDYRKNENVLDVSVYDRGVGFKSRISEFLGCPNMSSCDAIDWALGEGNSVDAANRAAGVGLNETVDFMRRNGGLMEIISGDAIWSLREGLTSMRTMSGEIVGSLVNFSIIMDSSVSYEKQIDIDESQGSLEIIKNEA